MSRTKNISLIAVGVAAGLGVVWFVRRRPAEISGLPEWQSVLAERHGIREARRLAELIRQAYGSLLAERPLPKNPALRRHVTRNILPGLALYRVLLQESNGDRQAALEMVDMALRESTLVKSRRLLAPMKILPTPFWLVRLFFKIQMTAFPAEGWDFHFTEDNNERFAFNATRCFYLNTLTTYGAPELTASFCKTDDVMAELFPPTVRFVRPHTLGRGNELCDFQYCRVPVSGQDVKQA